jgi:hypothetical protein
MEEKQDTNENQLYPVFYYVRLVIPDELLPSRARFRFTRQRNIDTIDLQCQTIKFNRKRVSGVRGHMALM